jgi:hypothetical protein
LFRTWAQHPFEQQFAREGWELALSETIAASRE